MVSGETITIVLDSLDRLASAVVFDGSQIEFFGPTQVTMFRSIASLDMATNDIGSTSQFEIDQLIA